VRTSAFVIALLATRAYAQPVPVTCTAVCPDGHLAPTLCEGTDDPCSSGGGSPSNMEAAREAERARFQAEVDEAVRGGTEEQQRAFRDANDRGIEAFKHHQWDRAVQFFEGAQRLDPSSTLVADNLQHARAEQAAERARKAAAAAPLHASDLRLPPPPSPLAPSPSPPVALDGVRDAWTKTVPAYDLTRWLAPARETARDAVALLPDFLKSAVFDGLAEHAKIAPHEWIDTIQSARDLSGAYRKVAADLVDKLQVEIYTGTDQTAAGGEVVTQFAEEKSRESIWDHVKAWGSHRAAGGPAE